MRDSVRALRLELSCIGHTASQLAKDLTSIQIQDTSNGLIAMLENLYNGTLRMECWSRKSLSRIESKSVTSIRHSAAATALVKVMQATVRLNDQENEH